MFQPIYRCFKKIGNSECISAWKSKVLPDVKPPATSNNSLSPAVNYINAKTPLKNYGSCLKQEKLTFNHKNVVNIYIM